MSTNALIGNLWLLLRLKPFRSLPVMPITTTLRPAVSVIDPLGLEHIATLLALALLLNRKCSSVVIAVALALAETVISVSGLKHGVAVKALLWLGELSTNGGEPTLGGTVGRMLAKRDEVSAALDALLGLLGGLMLTLDVEEEVAAIDVAEHLVFAFGNEWVGAELADTFFVDRSLAFPKCPHEVCLGTVPVAVALLTVLLKLLATWSECTGEDGDVAAP